LRSRLPSSTDRLRGHHAIEESAAPGLVVTGSSQRAAVRAGSVDHRGLEAAVGKLDLDARPGKASLTAASSALGSPISWIVCSAAARSAPS